MVSTNRTVAVAGSTGFVGQEVVRRLLADGHAVRALARDRGKARDVLPVNAGSLEIVTGDVTDPAAVADLLRGCDTCINLVGIIREAPGVTFEMAHVGAVQALTAAAIEARCGRFIQMSALGVGHDGMCEYQRSKWDGEQVVRSSGIPWTIFRPGLIHGPGSGFMQLAASWASGESAPWFFLPYFTRRVPDAVCTMGTAPEFDPVVSPVAVEDVASAFSSAVVAPQAAGEIYNLVGPETLAWPDLLRLVRDAIPDANHSLVPWGIPGDVAAIKARVAGAIGLGWALPFDEGMARMGMEDSTASLDKARLDLGFDPRPFSVVLARYGPEL